MDKSLKQTQKDKCTTEQFWAVATVVGMNAFLLTSRKHLEFASPWIIAVHSLFVSFYAIWFVIDRAKKYRKLDTNNKKLQWPDLKGLFIYVYLIFSSFCATAFQNLLNA